LTKVENLKIRKIDPKTTLPPEVIEVFLKIKMANFEVFLIGGCVRDIILKRKPKDWDLTTNAKPEDIIKIFKERSFYENKFGTVSVKTESNDPSLKIIEVTPYRIESKYSDFRHPDEVIFVSSLAEDVKRRDFTINALALDIEGNIYDYVDGLEDLKNKIIKAVGDPYERFKEDPLRMIRAVRFATELQFEIEKKSKEAIINLASFLEKISKERIRDELIKIIELKDGARGVKMLTSLGLNKYIIPELDEGLGVGQNKHHIYDVYEHNLKSLEYAIEKNFPLYLRFAALLHDIGKPRTKVGEGPNCTFYGHQVVGAKMTKEILERLKFPKDFIKKVSNLVYYHMFYYNVGQVTEKGVRRFINRVGIENIDDLLKLREADRIGSGVKKAFPYRLRHLKYMIEKVLQEPITPKMLKIKGNDLIESLKLDPGPRIGMILKILLDKVLDDPNLNEKEKLIEEAKKLNSLTDEELKKFLKAAEEKIEEFEKSKEAELRKKFNI